MFDENGAVGDSFDSFLSSLPSPQQLVHLKNNDSRVVQGKTSRSSSKDRGALMTVSANHSSPKRSRGVRYDSAYNHEKINDRPGLAVAMAPNKKSYLNTMVLTPSYTDGKSNIPPRQDRAFPSIKKSVATPYGKWKSDFQKYLTDNGFLGSLLIRGLEIETSLQSSNAEPFRGSSETKKNAVTFLPTQTVRQPSTLRSVVLAADTSDQERKDLLTKRDLDSLRYILITKSRSQKIATVQGMIFPGNGHQTLHYDQHGTFSNHVLSMWYHINHRIMRNLKVQSERLDWLIATTHILNEYDAWMYDHPEGNVDDMVFLVKSLSGFWYRVLCKGKLARENLGWDDKYTKPGVMELLNQFQAKVHNYPALGQFVYDA